MDNRGVDLEVIRESYERHGKPLTEDLFPPAIMGGYSSWMEAFWELGTDRLISEHGEHPIPWSAIEAYSKRFPPHERDLFYRAMRKIDREYLSHKSTGYRSGTKFSRETFRPNSGG